MRPPILFGLFASVSTLPGVGPKTAKLLEKLCGPRIIDLCWHLPHTIEYRRFYPSIKSVPHEALATIVVTVESHEPPIKPGRPYKVFCYDTTHSMTLVFFHAFPDYLQKALPVGKECLISGVMAKEFGHFQMAHPHHIGHPSERDTWVGTQPIYPLTASLHKKTFATVMKGALGLLPVLPEWIPQKILDEHQWPSWHDALNKLHHPESEKDLDSSTPAYHRLAFDEILAHQLMLKCVKHTQGTEEGLVLKGDGRYQQAVTEALPFSLTEGQKTVLTEIKHDLEGPKKMVRLLQGDVGSGKTLVALLSMLSAVEAGYQAVFLAPTEILAQQHYATFQKWCAGLPLCIGLFTGSLKASERRENLAKLQDGTLNIAIGTHALFEDDIQFQKLGLVVIDEQHRFGVSQRSTLIGKGSKCNVLAMTATPIPRTMALTLYGEIDISTLTEKPAYRQPIDTRILPLERLKDIYEGMKRVLEKGEQIYWVCPLIEESEVLTLGHVEQRFTELKTIFQDKVAFLHGRLKPQEKERIMMEFKEGRIQVLVSTTVIEVGMDVPNATIMVIEHAERFGLFQLHQLRGRVGRGSKPSTCLLLYAKPLSTLAQQRLQILRDTNDGFIIAEKDLNLRGSGDLLGTRQSGLPNFRFFRFDTHTPLLKLAYRYSQAILDQFIKSNEPLDPAFKCLLHLFNHAESLRYLKSG
jgi:ATP-dependent DNA helicase RecG